MRFPVSWIMSVFVLLTKLLEQNVRSTDREAMEIEARIKLLRRQQLLVTAEGNKARRAAAKMRDFYSE